jgi:hypothetical protein
MGSPTSALLETLERDGLMKRVPQTSSYRRKAVSRIANAEPWSLDSGFRRNDANGRGAARTPHFLRGCSRNSLSLAMLDGAATQRKSLIRPFLWSSWL